MDKNSFSNTIAEVISRQPTKFFVCLHGECNTSLALWKHHVRLLLQSFRGVSSDLHQC